MAIQTAEKLVLARNAIVNAITAKGGTAAADATLYECASAITNLTVQSLEENRVLEGDYAVTFTGGSDNGVYVGLAPGSSVNGSADVTMTGGTASILMATCGSGSITGDVTETVESSRIGSLRGIFGHRGSTFSDSDLMTVNGDFYLWIKDGVICRPAGYSPPDSEYQSGITGLVCYAKVTGGVSLTLDGGTLGDVRLSGNKSYVEGNTLIQLNGGTVTGNFFGINRGYWKTVTVNLAGTVLGTVYGYRAYNKTNNFQEVDGHLMLAASGGSVSSLYAVSGGFNTVQSEPFPAAITGNVSIALHAGASVTQCILLDKADVPQGASFSMDGGTAVSVALLSQGTCVETATLSVDVSGGTVTGLLTALNGGSSTYRGPGITLSVTGGEIREIAPVYGNCYSDVTLNLSGGSVTEPSDVSRGLSMGTGTVYGSEVWNVSGSFHTKFASSRGNCRKTASGTGGNFTVNLSGGVIDQFRLGQAGLIEGDCRVNVSGGSISNLFGGNGPQTIQGNLVFDFSGGTVGDAYGKYNAGTVQGSMTAKFRDGARVGKMIFVNQGTFAGNVTADCSGGTAGSIMAKNSSGVLEGEAVLQLHNDSPTAADSITGFTLWKCLIDSALTGTQCAVVNATDVPEEIDLMIDSAALPEPGWYGSYPLCRSGVLAAGSPPVIRAFLDGTELTLDADGWITHDGACSGCRVWLDGDTLYFGKL